MTEPITLHDAIMVLAADITTNDDLPDDVKLRWLEMLVTINAATSRHVLDGLDRLAQSLSDALGTVRPTQSRDETACERYHPGFGCLPGVNHPGTTETTVEEGEFADDFDFGDDTLDD